MPSYDPPHVTRFTKGNPGSLSLTDLLRQALLSEKLGQTTRRRRVADRLVTRMIQLAMSGRGSYMREILDRIDGPISRPDSGGEIRTDVSSGLNNGHDHNGKTR